MIPSNQYGFRTGLSTAHQITDLIFEITSNYNNDKVLCIDLIFLDKKDAFDSVSHGLLFEDFYTLGIRGNCLKTLESYVFNRKQSVT